nr:MAG TPA: hypothetical protein [Caudoviricetes sp.]
MGVRQFCQGLCQVNVKVLHWRVPCNCKGLSRMSC